MVEDLPKGMIWEQAERVVQLLELMVDQEEGAVPDGIALPFKVIGGPAMSIQRQWSSSTILIRRRAGRSLHLIRRTLSIENGHSVRE